MHTTSGWGARIEQTHTTRMMPKRGDELLDGGSLYWVIRGQIACRQTLLAITAFTDGNGIGRCRLSLDQKIVPVEPRPYRPFQGWRYLAAKDAPRDIDMGDRGHCRQCPRTCGGNSPRWDCCDEMRLTASPRCLSPASWRLRRQGRGQGLPGAASAGQERRQAAAGLRHARQSAGEAGRV